MAAVVAMDQRSVFLNVPKGKEIDIEFDNIVYTVANGRKGRIFFLIH